MISRKICVAGKLLNFHLLLQHLELNPFLWRQILHRHYLGWLLTEKYKNWQWQVEFSFFGFDLKNDDYFWSFLHIFSAFSKFIRIFNDLFCFDKVRFLMQVKFDHHELLLTAKFFMIWAYYFWLCKQTRKILTLK